VHLQEAIELGGSLSGVGP